MRFPRWMIAAMGVLLLVMGAGCGSSGGSSSSSSTGSSTGSAEPVAVRSAVVAAYVTAFPYYWASDDGSYGRAGVDVKPVSVQGGADIVKLLVAGKVDIAITGGTHAMLTRAKGEDVKIVQTLSQYGEAEMVTRRDLDIAPGDWQALKGRRCAATSPGGDSDAIMRTELKAHGLEPDRDVTIVYSGGFAEMVVALDKKRIDCAYLYPGVRAQVILNGTAVPFFSLSDSPKVGRGPSLSVIVKGDFLKQHPEAVKNFVKVTLGKVHDFYADVDAAKVVGHKLFDFKPQVIDEEFDRLAQIQEFPKDGRQDQAAYTEAAKTLVDAGVLPSAPPFAELYDESFLPSRHASR